MTLNLPAVDIPHSIDRKLGFQKKFLFHTLSCLTLRRTCPLLCPAGTGVVAAAEKTIEAIET